MLTIVLIVFLLDLAAEVYVEHKYDMHKYEEATNAFISHYSITSINSRYSQIETKDIPSVRELYLISAAIQSEIRSQTSANAKSVNVRTILRSAHFDPRSIRGKST
jgi:hypothetical protein